MSRRLPWNVRSEEIFGCGEIMKAVVFRQARGLVYEEVPDYRVAADEVLVRVANTGFCGSDHSLVAGGLVPDGYILGHEINTPGKHPVPGVDGGR